MTFKEIVKQSNMTIKELAQRFDIPYRTAQNWNSGQRLCVPYILKMMCEILKIPYSD